MKLFTKRIVCLALAIVLCLGVLSGCNNDGGEGSDVVRVLLTGSEMPDTVKVQNMVIEKIKAKTGLTVDFEVISTTAYDLAISSGEAYDIIQAPNWNNFWGNAQKGAFLEITDEDLKENAPYIWENGQDYINYTKYQGKRYAIPQLMATTADRLFVARGDLMEKYGFEKLDNLDDVEKFLDAVKAGEPDLIPFDTKGGAGFAFLAIAVSDLGWAPVGSLSYAEHVYFDLDDPEHKLFIAAEKPESLEVTKRMKRWNDKGFFSKSVLSNKTADIDSFKSGKTALAFINNPQAAQEIWDEFQKDDRKAWKPYFFTRYEKRQQYDTCLASNVAISAFSKNKANALKVMNVMYGDKEINQLMKYGIEGEHYTIDKDGNFSQTEKFWDVGPVTPGCFVAEYELPVSLNFPGSAELSQKLKDMSEVNPSVNMPTDDSNVREIKVALREIYNQYTLPRLYGVFEGTAEEALKRELDALKKAGIDTYMADLQKQLDAYYEEISK